MQQLQHKQQPHVNGMFAVFACEGAVPYFNFGSVHTKVLQLNRVILKHRITKLSIFNWFQKLQCFFFISDANNIPKFSKTIITKFFIKIVVHWERNGRVSILLPHKMTFQILQDVVVNPGF